MIMHIEPTSRVNYPHIIPSKYVLLFDVDPFSIQFSGICKNGPSQLNRTYVMLSSVIGCDFCHVTLDISNVICHWL